MINPREIPFVRWLLFFLVGILAAIRFNVEIPYLDFILIGLFILSFLAYRQKGWFKFWWVLVIPIYLFFIGFGYRLTWNQNDLNKENHFQNSLEKGCFLIGEIKEMPIKKKWIKLEIETTGIGTDKENIEECSGKLLTYIERDSLSETLVHGDVILVQSRFSEIEPPKNPNAFDYGRFLSFKNIHYQTFTRQGNWTILKKNEGISILSTALDLRSKFIEILRKYLPSENNFSVGSALILGYKDEISEEVQTAFAETGAMHVLAVSGLHVGIIYLILQILFVNRIKSFHPFWKWMKVIIPILGIWVFALLTGMSPSVKRAATMFSIFILGIALSRRKYSYNILAGSAFLILWVNPFLIMNVGFQLSYLAVFGILYFQPRIAKLWLIKNKIGNYFWQLSCVSIAAQLGTAPLGLFYFHQFPFYFLFSGLIVIPAAFLILGLGLALFLLESIYGGLGMPIGWILNGLIEGVNWAIFMLQNLPGSVAKGIWISGAIAFLIYLIIGKTAIAFETKNFKWILGALSVLTIISINYSFSKYRIFTNRKMVVYHVNKASAIDFFDGKDLIALTSRGIDEKSLNFAVQNNRWAEGSPEIQSFHFKDSTTHTLETWMFKEGFIQFYDKRIVVIDEPPNYEKDAYIEVDYLIIRNNPKLKIENLLNHFGFKKLIFDASNKFWQVENWEQECHELEVSFYNIHDHGAFILDLNDS